MKRIKNKSLGEESQTESEGGTDLSFQSLSSTELQLLTFLILKLISFTLTRFKTMALDEEAPFQFLSSPWAIL
jgi:hypothetical protein